MGRRPLRHDGGAFVTKQKPAHPQKPMRGFPFWNTSGCRSV